MQSGWSAGLRTVSQELPAASGFPSAAVTMVTLDNNWIRFPLLYYSRAILLTCVLMLGPCWCPFFFFLFKGKLVSHPVTVFFFFIVPSASV